MPKGMGKVYAIISYKATRPEDGLTQQEIADYIDRSVSTISRLLDTIVEMGFLNYTEEINERGKRERKYYMASDMGDIVVKRFQDSIEQNVHLKNSLQLIIAKMKKQDVQKHKEFLTHLEQMDNEIDLIIRLYEKASKLGEKKS
ncbi:MAG: helix-turn-helix domain-containing protein [Candidatus Thorarchaeota archaeon]|nr:helix-turn-helix domain-containing protein [Candidatus Thorarchaeota archaeon]